ncbi:ATP-binding protein [Temperatibacter marinus]|uniref:histidine kinase n=1 Tax=Temperatibacter marinus TaxID=1456591 RepID=A0AA52EDD4_9PROT|nr:ATP-binding protein [Temperatibacter marinus]WND01618.1 ATP-binding protein [Temperatibacter marinus]
MSRNELKPGRIWVRYAIALSVLFFLATAIFATAQYSIGISSGWAALINTSGKQRMLSQQILLHSEQVMIAHSQADLSTQKTAATALEKALSTFKANHEALSVSAKALSEQGRLPQEIQEFYLSRDQGSFETTLTHYLNQAQMVLTNPSGSHLPLIEMRRTALDPILTELNAVVDAFQLAADSDAAFLSRFELIAYILTIGVILIEIIFIFVPLNASIISLISSLKSSQRKLSLKNDKLTLALHKNDFLKMQQIHNEVMGNYGSWYLNLVTEEVYWSEGIYAIHKRPKERGLPSLEDAINYYSEADRIAVDNHIKWSAQNKAGFSFEYDLVCEDGSKARVMSQAQYQEFEGVPFLFGMFRDISNDRAISDTLREAAETANEKAKSRSDFLAVVSHEIKTPVTGIMGILELLVDMDLPEEAQKLIQAGNENNRLLMTIVNDILEMTRLESDRVKLIPTEFSPSKIVKDVFETHKPNADQKKLDFRNQTKGPDVLMIGDDIRIKQILHNFVTNAIKFTDIGAVELSSHIASKSDENNRKVTFKVKDSGIGIPQDKREDLFIAFEQLEDTFRRKQGGTGLGLAISDRLANLMAAKITVESEEGVGSTFSLELNLEEAIQSEKPVEAPIELEALKVLVAEDVSLNRTIIEKVMQNKWGLNLTFAHDGQEAIDICQTEMFDVILMDIQMPVIDGVQAVDIIRRSMVHHIDTPIYALTANTENDHIKSYFKVGMNGCFSKPFNWQEIKMTLSELEAKYTKP